MGNVWHQIGRENPYWGVLTEPQYHTDKLTPAALDEFFASGESHLEEILASIRQARPDFEPKRALDFGCGVGRITTAMSKRFSTVGVDISEGMLEEARKNVSLRGRADRATFTNKTDGCFDFTHSYITLQHMPVRQGIAAMRYMVRILNPGGVAMLHFPFHRFAPLYAKVIHQLRQHIPLLNPLVNFYQNVPISTPAMLGNCFNMNTVLLNASRDGGKFFHIEVEERGNYRLARVFVFA